MPKKTTPTTQPTSILNLDYLTKSHFRWDAVEYEYDRTSCSGRCSYYCRCSKIINAQVKSVDMRKLVKGVIGSSTDTLLNYCVDRLLTHSGMSKVDNYAVDIGSGYYGEEVDGVRFDDTLPTDELRTLEALDDKSRIEFVLKKEYGHLLPVLNDVVAYKVVYIMPDVIHIGQIDHYRRLNKDVVAGYKEYELPIGVCVFNDENGEHRLIDGYHRLMAARENGRSIQIICGYKKEQ